jgi:hypothetical protein
MPNDPPAESEHSKVPRRGRPKGSTHSARTRVQIAHTRSEQERKKREAREAAPLQGTFATLSLEMRRAITERDGKMCRSCGDPGPQLRVHSFLSGLDDLNALERDPELHAVLCSFCRNIANDMEARSMASLLRDRW